MKANFLNEKYQFSICVFEKVKKLNIIELSQFNPKSKIIFYRTIDLNDNANKTLFFNRKNI